MHKVTLSDFPYEVRISDLWDDTPNLDSVPTAGMPLDSDITDGQYKFATILPETDNLIGTGTFEGNWDSSDEELFYVRPVTFPEFRTFRADWHNDPNHNNLP